MDSLHAQGSTTRSPNNPSPWEVPYRPFTTKGDFDQLYIIREPLDTPEIIRHAAKLSPTASLNLFDARTVPLLRRQSAGFLSQDVTCAVLSLAETIAATKWFRDCRLWPLPAHAVMWKGGPRAVLSASLDCGQVVDQKKVEHVYQVLRAEKKEICQEIPIGDEDEQSEKKRMLRDVSSGDREEKSAIENQVCGGSFTSKSPRPSPPNKSRRAVSFRPSEAKIRKKRKDGYSTRRAPPRWMRVVLGPCTGPLRMRRKSDCHP